MLQQIRLIVAQLPATLGDLDANTRSIVRTAEHCSAWDAGLIIFPELFLIGYPPEDLLYQPELETRLKHAKKQLATASKKVDVLVGAPSLEHSGGGVQLHNSVWHFSAGKFVGAYHKHCLPNYGVFDERRYFLPGSDELLLTHQGKRLMLLVCEDAWEDDVVSRVRMARADLVVAVNASPFEYNKLAARKARISRLASETNCAWLYVNMVGAQDDLIFDGASFCCDRNGALTGQAREMEPQLWMLNYSDGYWQDAQLLPELDEPSRVFYALSKAVSNYVHGAGADNVLVGLSGGIDSAVTLAVAVAALGATQVLAVAMPYIHTRDISIEDARRQADNLGVKIIELPIHQAVDGLVASLGTSINWRSPSGKLALQNIQSRCRGSMLMALSNASGALVLSTGNKSEMAMGYATLYGDTAGAYAVLKDVDKHSVYRLAHWCNRRGEVIVKRIIERQPSAELAEDQLDSDSLPPYDVLDHLVRGHVEQRLPFASLAHACDEQTLAQVITTIERNEYKRRQSPPGPKVSQRAFGRDRRMPITNNWRLECQPDK